jgi:DNA-binding NarL/FixJ family response regulator
MRAAPDAPVVSVLSVEDRAAFLGAVRVVVGATSGFEVVAEAQSGEDALVVAARCDPAAVVSYCPRTTTRRSTMHRQRPKAGRSGDR